MQNTHRKRMAGSLLTVLSVVTIGTLLAGCSSDSDADSDHSSSKSQGATSGSSDSGGATSAGVAYARCMRAHGVSNFPDPGTDSHGGMKLVVPRGVDTNSTTFKSAQSACQSKLYQGDTDSAGGHIPFDATKVAAWAKCIRKNGLPDFQDPEVNGNTIIIDATALGVSGMDDPKFAKPAKACYGIRPGGMLAFQGVRR